MVDRLVGFSTHANAHVSGCIPFSFVPQGSLWRMAYRSGVSFLNEESIFFAHQHHSYCLNFFSSTLARVPKKPEPNGGPAAQPPYGVWGLRFSDAHRSTPLPPSRQRIRRRCAYPTLYDTIFDRLVLVIFLDQVFLLFFGWV